MADRTQEVKDEVKKYFSAIIYQDPKALWDLVCQNDKDAGLTFAEFEKSFKDMLKTTGNLNGGSFGEPWFSPDGLSCGISIDLDFENTQVQDMLNFLLEQSVWKFETNYASP